MRVFICLLVICLSINVISGLDCYTCSGGGDSYCNDPPNLSYIKPQTCGLQEICLKISSEHHVERRCGNPSICTTGINNNWKRCETCEGDLCNKAVGNGMNIYLAVLLVSFGLGRTLYTLNM